MSAPRCPTGKVRYRDRVAAHLAMASTGRNDHRRDKNEARAYRCPACRGWHLTSQARRHPKGAP